MTPEQLEEIPGIGGRDGGENPGAAVNAYYGQFESGPERRQRWQKRPR